jgi:pimeloyl-ACP methyl ester carboxylesterase
MSFFSQPLTKGSLLSRPTIVLVHGAFADASIWRRVYDQLARDGQKVLAPPNPLRGIPYDASYTESVIDQLDGPVVLVGHSYGGAVITVAGSSDKVAGLVYVAGVVPDEGESVNDLQGRFPSLAMGPLVRPLELPDGSVEISIDPDRFPDVFGADLPADDAAFRANSQRSLAATAFDDPATAAAWRAKPSWAVFGTGDRPLAPELHRFSYDRAGSKVTEVEGASHLLMLSQPEIVAGVIREAVIASTVSTVA